MYTNIDIQNALTQFDDAAAIVHVSVANYELEPNRSTIKVTTEGSESGLWKVHTLKHINGQWEQS
jgi:hypothetical protein